MPNLSTSVFRVFLPFAAGYFLSYLFRVVNAVIAPDLVADLNIDPSQLGLLTSTYFIAFASSQLPLGLFLDRLGPKKVETFLLMFAGTGALIFAKSQTLAGVIIGRALIGFGVSACLMAAFKSYVLWFQQDMWPRVNGFQMAAGGFGALCATTPVESLMQITDWRGLFLLLSAISFGCALLVFFVVPEKKSAPVQDTLSSQIKGIRQIFSSMQFWRIAPLATMSQATFLSMQGLWAGPWLRDVARLSRPDTAAVLFGTAVCMVAGFILLGFITEKLFARGIKIHTCAVFFMIVFFLIQTIITFHMPVRPAIAWGLFGFFGTSGILSYSALSYSFPKELSGRVTTGINLLVFIAAFALQWAIGGIINLWDTTPGGSYHPDGYRAALLMTLGLQAVCVIWNFAAPKITSNID